MLRKTFIAKVFLSLYLLGMVFAPMAKAQFDTWYSPDFKSYYQKVFDTHTPDTEIFGERYTAAQVMWIFWSIPAHIVAQVLGPDLGMCIVTGGADILTCIEGVKDKVVDNFNKMFDFFGLPFDLKADASQPQYANEDKPMQFVYSFFYNNPISGVGYILRKANNLNIVPEANAQGFGYIYGAGTVQRLWTITKNVSYSFLIIASVILAFMVMFRVKLSPQAVITAQSALPRVLIAIILITFSYAIAGLLIDLMYVVIGLMVGIIKSAGLVGDYYSATEFFKDMTVDRNAFILSWQYLIAFLIAVFTTLISASFFGGIILIIVWIILFFIVLFNSFRVMWTLIKTFINIVLLIVAAPFHMLFGVLSISGSTGFFPWVKQMIANLAVYPIVGGMFFLAFFFLSQSLNWGASGPSSFATFIVPFEIHSGILDTTTSWDPPLTWGTNSGRFLWAMASLVVFMGIPKASDIAKQLIMGGKFDYGTAIGEITRGAVSTAGGVIDARKSDQVTRAELALKAATPGSFGYSTLQENYRRAVQSQKRYSSIFGNVRNF
jgi:hypothetical protein